MYSLIKYNQKTYKTGINETHAVLIQLQGKYNVSYFWQRGYVLGCVRLSVYLSDCVCYYSKTNEHNSSVGYKNYSELLAVPLLLNMW